MFSERYLNYFLGTVSQAAKLNKISCLTAIVKDNYKIGVIVGS